MKTSIKSLLRKAAAVLLLWPLASCGEDGLKPVMPQSYRLELPAIPASWLEVLGEADWYVEWVDADGGKRSAEVGPGASPSAAIMREWAAPVLAWPHWPGKGIKHGTMKPAGAIFPLDADGGSLRLSWLGGVEASFYWELAALAGEKRLPHLFNWPRFRELLSSEQLAEDVRLDPWLADWKSIAVKTAASGFDSRRITAQKLSPVTVDIPADGPWVGVSPFAPSEDWATGESAVLQIGEQAESYFSPSGVLRCSLSAWIWVEYSRSQ
jgi:hypothetical protein